MWKKRLWICGLICREISDSRNNVDKWRHTHACEVYISYLKVICAFRTSLAFSYVKVYGSW